MLRDLEESICGPLVGARQIGLEQRKPTRAAIVLFTSSLKSSLMWFYRRGGRIHPVSIRFGTAQPSRRLRKVIE